MASVSSTTSSTGSADLRSYVQQLMANDRLPLQRLETQRTQYQERLKTYQGLATRLSSLWSLSRSISAADSSNPLRKMTVGGNDAGVLEATADATARTGVYKIEIEQLAQRQVLASGRVDGSEVASFKDSGKKGEAKAEESVRFRLAAGGSNIEIHAAIPKGSTMAQALRILAQAINGAGGLVTATVLDAGGGVSQLLLRAKDSGTSSRITEIQDLEGAWMGKLGLTLASRKTDLSNPQVQDGTQAVIWVDGVRITAESNVLKNVIPGVTLTLKSTGTQTLQVARDEDSTVKKIQDFVAEYNKTVSDVRSRTQAASSSSSQDRGLLAGDVTFSRLRITLRDAVVRPISQDEGVLRQFSQIGLSLNREGLLEISDEEALRGAIESNPDQVDRLWRGVGSRLSTLLEGYSKTGGVLAKDQQTVRSQIQRLDGRISETNQSLSRREDSLMNQMAQIQSSIGLLSQQQQYLSSLLAWSDQLYV